MKFNLYFFNPDYVSSFSDLLKVGHWYEDELNSSLKEFDDFEYQIYYKDPIMKQPDWLRFINQWLEDSLSIDKKAVSSIILLKLNWTNLFFAITFWTSHYIIEKDKTAKDFWLKTVLNSIPYDKITIVDWKKLGSNVKETRVIHSKTTNFSDFWLNEIEELLTYLEWKTIDESLWVKLSWKDSLWFNISLKNFWFHQLWNQIKKYYDIYVKDDYKENFSFIDNYKIENNKDNILNLNNLLIDFLLDDTRDFSKISFSIPDMLNNINVYDFKVKYDGETLSEMECLDDEEIISIIKFVLSWMSNDERLEGLINILIAWNDSESNLITEVFKLYQIINFETDYNWNKYVLHNWTWNIVSEWFIDDINNTIDLINFIESTSSWIHTDWNNYIKFDKSVHFVEIEKDWKKLEHKSEWKFNENFTSSLWWILLDKKNFTKLPWKSKVEICDILKDNKFYHIKRWNHSSTLSHLFNQSYVSLELFKKFPPYIDSINSHWVSLKQNDKIEVILWIIINWNIKKKIPFFSKIALRNLYLNIKAMWADLSILQIEEI